MDTASSMDMEEKQMKISIPFNEWSEERIQREKKFATTRSKQYGKAGDWFMCAGKTCEIEFVVKLPLWFIFMHLYDTEGADSPGEFSDVWCSIHPRKSWESMLGKEYFYHFFSILNPDEAKFEVKT
jgi:hypothetical protein